MIAFLRNGAGVGYKFVICSSKLAAQATLALGLSVRFGR